MNAGSRPLTEARIQRLLEPFSPNLPAAVAEKLLAYLDLLLRWNSRTNLTAIRDPEEIVVRHFGESLFAARHLPASSDTLLDIGSGAGFPGIPMALTRPDCEVTLAESQGKKAAFLQEAVRVLGIGAQVWPKRVELLPAERRFSIVTVRAVDNSAAALALARKRVATGGALFHLTSRTDEATNQLPIPGTDRRVLLIERLPG